MKTLYDLLGARPGDDAERLRSAFRRAAKAYHPDHHSGDRGAPNRFQEVVEAYDILRNTEQRANYDRLLEFERFERRSRLRRAISCYVSNAVATAGAASVLAGGYMLVRYILEAPVHELARIGSAKIAAVQPLTRTDPAKLHELRNKPAGMSGPDMPLMAPSIVALTEHGDAPEVAEGGTVSDPAGQTVEVAKADDSFSTINQNHAKIAADHPDAELETQPVDRDEARSNDVRFSSREKVDGVPTPSLPDVAMADGRHDTGTPDKRDTGTYDVKGPELKLLGRPRVEARRDARNHKPLKQALLENRNTSACAGPSSCSADMPPLFGVGF